MRGERKKKVLAIASGGGHWVQLLRLRPALAGDEVTYVTVRRAYRVDVGAAPFHTVVDATRWSPLRLVVLVLQVAWIVARVRPDVVVTTGAAPGYFAVRLARWFGARSVWIDSIANVDALSLSGDRALPHADLALTQWPLLARPGGPQYEGAVL
jgi:UDP-N-acetylglucosamine:LPS N-acetylglucosamine transferase